MNGQSQTCVGVGSVAVCASDSVGDAVKVDVCVIDFKPLGYDFVLGMNGIMSLGGLSIFSSGGVSLGRGGPNRVGDCLMGEAPGLCASALAVERKDFRVDFRAETKSWVAEWRWMGGHEPPQLKNNISEYSVPIDVRPQYEAEVQRWVDSGWLQPYDEDALGPP